MAREAMENTNDLLAVVYGGGDAAVEAAEQLAGIARWVSCTERLPEIAVGKMSAVVLAWMPGQEWPSPAFLILEHGKRVWKWQHDRSPTHWRSMPEIPA